MDTTEAKQTVPEYEVVKGFMRVGRQGGKIHPCTEFVYPNGRRSLFPACSCPCARTPNTYKTVVRATAKTCNG